MEYTRDRAGKHWGDYQWEGHDYDSLAADPTMDVDRVTGIESAAVGQQVGRLSMIPSTVRSSIVQTLVGTRATASGSGATIRITAVPARDGEPNRWLAQLVARGYVVLLNKSQARDSHVEAMATIDPSVISRFAEHGGEWVIVDGPWPLINQAQQAPGVPLIEPARVPVATSLPTTTGKTFAAIVPTPTELPRAYPTLSPTVYRAAAPTLSPAAYARQETSVTPMPLLQVSPMPMTEEQPGAGSWLSENWPLALGGLAVAAGVLWYVGR